MDVLGFHLPDLALPLLKGPQLPPQKTLRQPYANKWGVFNFGGDPVFDVDTCVAVDYDNKSTVSRFPVEDGSFTSFNKVENPYDAKVKLTVSGQERISTLLEDLETELASTNLYYIFTPERIYVNATIEKYSYKREKEHGQNIVTVTLDLIEVRTVMPQYTSTAIVKPKAPKATPKKLDGTKQAEKPFGTLEGGVSLKDVSFKDIIPLALKHVNIFGK